MPVIDNKEVKPVKSRRPKAHARRNLNYIITVSSLTKLTQKEFEEEVASILLNAEVELNKTMNIRFHIFPKEA